MYRVRIQGTGNKAAIALTVSCLPDNRSSGCARNLGKQVKHASHGKMHTENTESYFSVFSVCILQWPALSVVASNFGIEGKMEFFPGNGWVVDPTMAATPWFQVESFKNPGMRTSHIR
jgi:hypothetical protein